MSALNPVKRVIKRGLQHIAATIGPHRRHPRMPKLLVLMYHRILPVDDPRFGLEEPGMVVTPETFDKHLGAISELFDFISVSEWVAAAEKNTPLPPKACAITFDDGWADNYEFGFPILKKYRAPATIFIVSDMIGTNKPFWPERLAHTLTNISTHQPELWSHPLLSWVRETNTDFSFGGTPLQQEEISQFIAHAKSFSDTEIHKKLDNIEQTLGISTSSNMASLLTWEQVKEMTDSGLIKIGSHTCNHIRLTDMTPPAQLQTEVVDSKRNIENKIKMPVDTFCFPNGDYSPQALALVKGNYKAAVTTNSGWNSINDDAYLLRRIGIHEDITSDKTAFLARISGWM